MSLPNPETKRKGSVKQTQWVFFCCLSACVLQTECDIPEIGLSKSQIAKRSTLKLDSLKLNVINMATKQVWTTSSCDVSMTWATFYCCTPTYDSGFLQYFMLLWYFECIPRINKMLCPKWELWACHIARSTQWPSTKGWGWRQASSKYQEVFYTAWVQSVSPRGLRWLTLVTLVNADYAG